MKKIKGIFYIWCAVFGLVMAACVDDDSFTTSTSHVLSFSTDTLSLDTTFSNVPTPTKTMWVYNRSGKGIRCQNVRLEGGNQNGFRVNVDGSYLGQTAGFQTHDVEIRKGDSIRVFVELTSKMQHSNEPNLVEDNLIFQLESGVQQKVNLHAYSWDALLWKDGKKVAKGETEEIANEGKPIVVYGGIKVDSTATLTIKPGVKLYFHENAGLDVYGTLHIEGEKGNEVLLRGDRIDNMFDYLPYDRTPGQWQGLRLRSSSVGNKIQFADIHSTYNGILVDSCHDESIAKQSKLEFLQSTIHNCQGYGVKVDSAAIVTIENCLISNTLNHCLYVYGGSVSMNYTTLAQFYPFDYRRASAIGFKAPVHQLDVSNSLVTGYADDEVVWTPVDEEPLHANFSYSVLRTVQLSDKDKEKFPDIVFGDSILYEEGDSIERDEKYIYFGKQHFSKFDTDNFIYDFHLCGNSAAVGWANPKASAQDRDGNERDSEKPDAGCYQRQEKKEDKESGK